MKELTTLQELFLTSEKQAKFTRNNWTENEYIFFDGVEWIGSDPKLKSDKSANWKLWRQKTVSTFWLNVYPKSALYCETREQAQSVAQPGRIALMKIEVPYGKFD